MRPCTFMGVALIGGITATSIGCEGVITGPAAAPPASAPDAGDGAWAADAGVGATPDDGSLFRRVALDELCVTTGSIEADGALAITEPKVRAVVPGARGTTAELQLVYRGHSADEAPLSSGEVRRQVGLKLLAQDTCNLVYVMWRVEPEPGLVVSVKNNPGQDSHDECGAGGYRTVTPRSASEVPLLEPGAFHTLRATLAGDELLVWADGALVWEGPLGIDAPSLHGPAGLRTDNIEVDFDLLAWTAPAPPPGTQPSGDVCDTVD